MILPAISIKEPWASMIAHGEKTIEVRKWRTKHRGDIILCASASPKSDISGKAFALVDILDVRPMIPEDKKYSGGFFDAECFSWVLVNIRNFKPFPIKGKLSIFKIDTKKKITI